MVVTKIGCFFLMNVVSAAPDIKTWLWSAFGRVFQQKKNEEKENLNIKCAMSLIGLRE